jgi:hypothetical protein
MYGRPLDFDAMASSASQSRISVGQTRNEKSSARDATSWKTLSLKPALAAAILLSTFCLIQSRVPMRSAVQIGADEGFEVAKATLCLHGHKLYSEVWNDQPPLHTFLITNVFKHVTRSILGARLLTTAFATALLACILIIVWRASGLFVGALATALLIASPGFVELSSSCMLEIPALATAVAGLCTLFVVRPSKWHVAEFLSGAFFGIAALMKLVPVYLLPLAALIVWLRQLENEKPASFGVPLSVGPRHPKAALSRSGWHLTLSAALNSLRGLLVPLLVMGGTIVATFVLVDWLIERGAYLAHFQQSWSSHFGGVKSFEHGSPADYGFDWSIPLKNWDMTVPAVLGICILTARLLKGRTAILPLSWLGLVLVIFPNHKPWWSYYYVHIAIPLCWCAAVGIEFIWASFVQKRLRRKAQGRPKTSQPSSWAYGTVAVFAICAAAWMGSRVLLQVESVRNAPQLHAAIVLKEIEPLKPFSRWMYADQLVYSFHANLPMPPPLAVVPLKRLWAGDMTNERLTAEMARFKPEIILLRNDIREGPFQELLENEYRLVYQDESQRLYAERATIRRLDLAKRSSLHNPQGGLDK